jgi:L-rhamnose isomerase
MQKKPHEEGADTMLMFLSDAGKGLLNIHAMRREVEQFTHADHLKPTYYDRWLRTMAALCIETGVFSN